MTDEQKKDAGIRINNLVMRVVAVNSTTVKVEVAEVFAETMVVGGAQHRTIRVSEWRDPTDAEREAFEALAWS